MSPSRQEKVAWLSSAALRGLQPRGRRAPRRCRRRGGLRRRPGRRPAGPGRQRAVHRDSGEVRILAGDDELARLGPGETIGELSVIDQQPRAASAVARADTVCLALASWDLIALIERDPSLALNLMRQLAGRLRRADVQLPHERHRPRPETRRAGAQTPRAPRLVVGEEGRPYERPGRTLDALARLSLFSDLARPQLEAVAHTMSEESFPRGQRILRQGFAGSGFYVILDGEVVVRIDGEDRARLGKGDFFGETPSCSGSPPSRTSSRCTPAPRAPPGRAGPARLPAHLSPGDVPDAPVGQPPAGACERRADATAVTRSLDAPPSLSRPLSRRATTPSSSWAAGRAASRRLLPARGWASTTPSSRPTRARRDVPALPVLPAAALVDQALRRAGRTTPASTSATTGTRCSPTSRSTAPSWPASWTAPRSSRRARRWRGPAPASPSVPGSRVRYETRWEATARDGDAFVLHTGTATTAATWPIFAVGVAEPLLPATPGSEHAAHYVGHPGGRELRGQAAVHHRQAELRRSSSRAGLLQWASPIILASPRPAQLSVNTHSLAGRAGALRPALGGRQPGRRGVHPERLHRAAGASRRAASRSTPGAPTTASRSWPRWTR